MTSGRGTPVDVVVTGSTGADARVVFGDRAEVSEDLLVARGSGVPVPSSGADLAVPLRLDDLAPTPDPDPSLDDRGEGGGVAAVEKDLP